MIKACGRKWEAKVYDRKRLGPDNPDDACRLRGKRIGRLNPDTWKELNVFIPPPSPPPFGSLLRRFAFNLCVCVCVCVHLVATDFQSAIELNEAHGLGFVVAD